MDQRYLSVDKVYYTPTDRGAEALLAKDLVEAGQASKTKGNDPTLDGVCRR